MLRHNESRREHRGLRTLVASPAMLASAPMNDTADHPDIVALPPIVFGTAFLVGLVLNLAHPLWLDVSTPGRWIGGVVFVLAIVSIATARVAFVRAGTNVNPFQPATAVVADGLFRFTRNPMYVGMCVAFAALAVVTRVGWLLIVLVPTMVIIHWGVVLREERYLADKFGEAYQAYRKKVRRYL